MKGFSSLLFLLVLAPIASMAILGCGGAPDRSVDPEEMEMMQAPEVDEEPLEDPNDEEGLEPSDDDV